MITKQITDISDSLEKLGYEIINIKEKKEIRITITPIDSDDEKKKGKIPESFLESFGERAYPIFCVNDRIS